MHIRDPSATQRSEAVDFVSSNVSTYAASFTGCTNVGSAVAFEDLGAAVADAWLVFEAVPEKLSIKIDTFAELEALAPADALLCSNSSSYKSSEMLEKVADATKRRILNTHYFMPTVNMVVELMTDGYTEPAIFPFLVERHREAGLKPYVARKESTGFIFNRVWAAIKREFLMIMDEGVSVPQELDEVWVHMFGDKLKPCDMMDRKFPFPCSFSLLPQANHRLAQTSASTPSPSSSSTTSRSAACRHPISSTSSSTTSPRASWAARARRAASTPRRPPPPLRPPHHPPTPPSPSSTSASPRPSPAPPPPPTSPTAAASSP